MKKIIAIIERASDGSYSVYHDDLSMGYLVTGTGDTAEEAIQCFNDGYEDFRRIYKEEGKPFKEVELYSSTMWQASSLTTRRRSLSQVCQG